MIKNRSAFTLVELMIVVVIIAVLSVVSVGYYRDSLRESQEAVVRNNLKTVRKAISMYFKDHMAYPKKLESLTGPYLKGKIPELLIYPLSASSSVYVEVPTDDTYQGAFQATETKLIYYDFGANNDKEIKNVKIKINDHIMSW